MLRTSTVHPRHLTFATPQNLNLGLTDSLNSGPHTEGTGVLRQQAPIALSLPAFPASLTCLSARVLTSLVSSAPFSKATGPTARVYLVVTCQRLLGYGTWEALCKASAILFSHLLDGSCAIWVTFRSHYTSQTLTSPCPRPGTLPASILAWPLAPHPYFFPFLDHPPGLWP